MHCSNKHYQNMKKLALQKILAVVWGVLLFLPLFSHAANVENIRVWRAPDNTRIVFDLSSSTEHKLLTMPGERGNAQRIVVILPKAQFLADEKKINLKNTPVSAFHAEKMGEEVRLILDLSARVKPKSFVLPANNQYGNRLVLDLFDETAVSEVKTAKPSSSGIRDIVVAVDAGHGGEDPGARSSKGIFEKDVTLAIARELAKKLIARQATQPF